MNMKMKPTLFLLPLVFPVGIVHAGSYDSQDLAAGYSYLNQLRIRAGMTEFVANPQLEQAALNHANYLADNFLIGHYELEGTNGFTGIQPNDRVVAAGYRSLLVSENVSSGDTKTIEAINGLMSAIYHRFTFLDFVKNEVGIGISLISDPYFHSAFVFNMGNSEHNQLCQGANFTGSGVYYYNICFPNIKISDADFRAVSSGMQDKNPDIVQWPANGDSDVPPAFFEESPDPLPDYSVSGYPISIQFNPFTFTDVGLEVTTFKLFRGSTEIQLTRLLTKSTDPNKQFSALEYALFPLERLDWNTAYRVEVGYVTLSSADTLTWHFTTRNLGIPLYTVQGEGEEILISPQTKVFAFYVPSTSRFPDIGGGINFRYTSRLTVTTAFEDKNTVRVNISGDVGQWATFYFSGNRSLTVRISADVTEAENPTENNPVEPKENTIPVYAIEPASDEEPIDYYRNDATGDIWGDVLAWQRETPARKLPQEMWKFGLRSIYLAKYACLDQTIRQWMPTNISRGILFCTNPENKQQTIAILLAIADRLEAASTREGNRMPVYALDPAPDKVPIDYYRNDTTGDVWGEVPAWQLPPPEKELPENMWEYGLRSIYLAKYACWDQTVRDWMPSNIANGIWYCTNPDDRPQTINLLRNIANEV
jgi:hypothetical protein